MPKIIASYTALLVLACSCATGKTNPEPVALNPRQAFAQITIGASRAEVEKILGPPVWPEHELEGDSWYLPPPELNPWDSPWGPGSILLSFAGDRVVAKELNPHVRP